MAKQLDTIHKKVHTTHLLVLLGILAGSGIAAGAWGTYQLNEHEQSIVDGAAERKENRTNLEELKLTITEAFAELKTDVRWIRERLEDEPRSNPSR